MPARFASTEHARADVARFIRLRVLPAETITCGGLEQAWWSEHEWEEVRDHLGSD